jgi:hypothetical protein
VEKHGYNALHVDVIKVPLIWRIKLNVIKIRCLSNEKQKISPYPKPNPKIVERGK